MKAMLEVRLKEQFAHLVASPDEGELLPLMGIRRLLIPLDDPRIELMREMDRYVREECDSLLFFGWLLHWKYTKAELESAELFFISAAPFEPCGELCDTQFDESTTCPHCGDGRRQTSDLVLDLRKMSKSRDIARTIADEWVVSQRLAEILIANKVTGYELAPVRHKARYQDDALDLTETPTGRRLLLEAAERGIAEDSWEYVVWLNRPEIKEQLASAWQEYGAHRERAARRSRKPLPVWYELKITARIGHTAPPTRFGFDPIRDDDDEHCCPLGHVSGLNLISEVHVRRDAWDGSDIAVTTNKYGVRRGVLVPDKIVVISPRLFWILKEHKIRAFEYSVAHFVD